MQTIKNIWILIPVILFIYGCQRDTPSDITGNGLPPAVPTNVKIYSAYDGEIEIVWHANTEIDLKGYNIYRSTDSTNFDLIDFSDQNYYLDDSLNYTTRYYYRITSLDIENRESEPSSVVSAEPINIYRPLTPRFLTINARNWIGNISVYLSWNPGYETDIAGFKIYRSTVTGFDADSSTLVGFSDTPDYSDTSGLILLTPYYYRIKAVDKGNLESNPTYEVNDLILPIPNAVSPIGNVRTNTLTFKFIALPVPATYKVSLQTNPYFGEFWSKEISTNTVNDTISINFDGNYIDYNVDYYWRISTYTINDSDPNSISQLFNFMLLPE